MKRIRIISENDLEYGLDELIENVGDTLIETLGAFRCQMIEEEKVDYDFNLFLNYLEDFDFKLNIARSILLNIHNETEFRLYQIEEEGE